MYQTQDAIKNKKLKYFECNEGELHQGEQLNYVTLDPAIPNNGLVCGICKQLKHSKHKVIPLKIFLADVSQKIHQNQTLPSNNIEEVIEKTEEIYKQILLNLKLSVEKMSQQIKKIEQSIMVHFRNIKSQMYEQNSSLQYLPGILDLILSSEYEDAQQLKDDIKKIIDNLNISQGMELDYKPKRMLEAYATIANDFAKEINTTQNQLTASFQKIEKQFFSNPIASATAFLSQKDFAFQQPCKSTTISISKNKIANQNSNQSSKNRFALIEPSLIKVGTTTQWAFKIVQLKTWIGLGIALKKVLEGKNYDFEFQNVGHGSYLFSCNGYTWSHSKKENNSQNKGINFDQGNIVILELNWNKKILSCQKVVDGKLNQKAELAVELEEDEEIYACVNLCDAGEKVEIVDVPNLSKKK